MVSVTLDTEAERYLADILAQEEIDSSHLIKQLLFERWMSLQSQPPQSQQTVLERMGGYPDTLLQGAEDLSDREVYKPLIAESLQRSLQDQYQPD